MYAVSAGKKVVRALYDYQPSVVGANDKESDLRFNKGDIMVIIRE